MSGTRSPVPPGRKLGERSITCPHPLCRGQAVEVVVATAITPHGVKFVVCRRCDAR